MKRTFFALFAMALCCGCATEPPPGVSGPNDNRVVRHYHFSCTLSDKPYEEEPFDIVGLSAGFGLDTFWGKIDGLQLAVLGAAADSVRGIQIAPLFSFVSNGCGLQVSTISGTPGQGSFSGLEIGLLGTVSSGNGIQISPVLNCTEDGVGDLRNDLERGRESEWNGLQLAFLANRACYLNGVQLAAGMNYAVRCRGIQVSAWNRADELEGIQFGLFNRAWSGSGVQIGLFNVFGSEENADLIPLPLLNARF